MLADLRYAVRVLLKTPGVSAAAALSLALGIGANATIFGWVKAVLLEPLGGVPRQSEIVVIPGQLKDGEYVSASFPDYRDFKEKATAFSGIAGAALASFNLAGVERGQRAERLWGSLVTANYFDVLDLRAAHGRTFLAEEDRVPNGAPVVVIGHGLWQRRFGGSAAIVGTPISLNGHPFTIVGVMPPEFHGSTVGFGLEIWVPMMMQPQLSPAGDRLSARGSRWMECLARLKPDATVGQADAEIRTIASQLSAAYPTSNGGFSAAVLPLWRSPFGAQFVLGPVLLILSGVVGVVLLLACANVANLLLARALARRREIAIRLSIGASRGRLVRQMLVESLVLAVLGGAGGLAVAWMAMGVLMAFAPPTDMPVRLVFEVDGTVMAFTAAVAMATGVLFGLVPALQGTRPDVIDELKDESGSSGGRKRARLRSTLVVVQVALSLIMLVAAGLFLRSLSVSQTIAPGFNPDGVLLAAYDVFPNGYSDTAGLQFHRRLAEDVRALPGVVSAAIGRSVPLGIGGSTSTRITIDEYVPRKDEQLQIHLNTVGPEYFRTMQIPLLAGREFSDRDDAAGARVAIVNEAMARRYWNRPDVVGTRIRIGGKPLDVIGVVATGKYQTIGEAPRPYLYLPMAQNYKSDVVLHVRTAGDPAAFAPTLRDVVARMDPNLPLYDVKSLRAHMAFATFTLEFAATLLGAFGALALALAAVGLYSVMAYAVSQRTREVGIRMALGARPSDVLRLIVGQGMALLAIGLGIGVAIALGAMPLMAPVLVGVSGRDPLTFAAVALLLGAVALVASFIPARRAAAVDPLAALRR
jgi:predicted permease